MDFIYRGNIEEWKEAMKSKLHDVIVRNVVKLEYPKRGN